MKTNEELADEWRYNNCNHRDFENIKDANRAAEKVVEAFKAGVTLREEPTPDTTKEIDDLAREWAEKNYKQWQGFPDPGFSGGGYDDLEGCAEAAYKAGYAQALKDAAEPEPIPYETNS